jgi:hypothetical protein
MEGAGVAGYKSTARDLGAFICFEDEAGQDADGGGLAGAVRPEKGVHLTSANLKIEPVERAHATISLGQPRRAYRHAAHTVVISRCRAGRISADRRHQVPVIRTRCAGPRFRIVRRP